MMIDFTALVRYTTFELYNDAAERYRVKNNEETGFTL